MTWPKKCNIMTVKMTFKIKSRWINLICMTMEVKTKNKCKG